MKNQKWIKKGVLASTLLLALLAASHLSAQKMGYVNSISLLGRMPEIDRADTIIMELRDSLVAVGEERAKKLQEKYIRYMTEINEGTVPPVEIQKRQDEVQKEQEALQQFENEISLMLGQKRDELYGPILSALQEAIDKVGKEGGYQFIFDASTVNLIIFAEESVDVTDQVLAKLGMEAATEGSGE